MDGTLETTAQIQHPQYSNQQLIQQKSQLVFRGHRASRLGTRLGQRPAALLREHVTWLNFGSACSGRRSPSLLFHLFLSAVLSLISTPRRYWMLTLYFVDTPRLVLQLYLAF